MIEAQEGSDQGSELVLIQVVGVQDGREIAWGGNVADHLKDRLADIRAAVAAGAQAIAGGLDRLPEPGDWRVEEVSASFGITLAAEAGVILSKASAEATFEVTITYQQAS